MSIDLGWADTAALAFFLFAWLGYDLMARLVGRGRNINDTMRPIRREWMLQLLTRENRIADSSLVGHTIHSISFFASTTMIVIAGIIGVLGGLEHAYAVANSLYFVTPMSENLFEDKLLTLLGVFVVAFFRFTWALRQYNYLCVLIGAAPPIGDTAAHEPAARELGELLNHAVSSFNNGLRTYYFAICVLAWIAGAAWFALGTLITIFVLLIHHYQSPASKVLAAHVARLHRSA